MSWGGSREGAGRKSKAEELGLIELIDSQVPIEKQNKIWIKLGELAEGGNITAIQLFLAYRFGKPTDKVDFTSNGYTIGQSNQDLSKLSTEELYKLRELQEKMQAKQSND